MLEALGWQALSELCTQVSEALLCLFLATTAVQLSTIVVRLSQATLDGVELYDAVHWTVHIMHSETVAVNACNIWGDQLIPNSSGIVIDGSRRVYLGGNIISTADNAITVKATSGAVGAGQSRPPKERPVLQIRLPSRLGGSAYAGTFLRVVSGTGQVDAGQPCKVLCRSGLETLKLTCACSKPWGGVSAGGWRHPAVAVLRHPDWP